MDTVAVGACTAAEVACTQVFRAEEEAVFEAVEVSEVATGFAAEVSGADFEGLADFAAVTATAGSIIPGCTAAFGIRSGRITGTTTTTVTTVMDLRTTATLLIRLPLILNRAPA